ncbi:hypothetical protein Bca4012_020067 [Brassica carinata]
MVPIKSRRITKTINHTDKDIMSSTDSSPHPDDLLIDAPKPPASPSLTLPPPSIDFGVPPTAEEIEAYNKLPPCPKAISDYILDRIGNDLGLYKPFMERIHNYLNERLGNVKTHPLVEASTSQKQKKKPKFKKVRNFYK